MYAPEIYGLAVRKYCWIEWELLFQTDARTCILNTDRSPLVESIVVFSLCTTFSSFFSHSCKLWPNLKGSSDCVSFSYILQQTEILKFVFVTYFRVLKTVGHSPLLSPVLEGLAMFAHLINVDFFSDLMAALQTLLINKVWCSCSCCWYYTLQLNIKQITM